MCPKVGVLCCGMSGFTYESVVQSDLTKRSIVTAKTNLRLEACGGVAYLEGVLMLLLIE